MAKSPPRTRFLLIRTSKHTGIFFMRKEGEELCPGGTELSKALAPFFSETRCAGPGFPSWLPRLHVPSHRS
jgi:hypothetical protein